MLGISPNRPSPSMIVAFSALMVALGGTSFAGDKLVGTAAKAKPGPSHGDSKQDAALVKSLAATLSVSSANTAGSATNAAHASTADSAASATNAAHAAVADSAPLPTVLARGRSLTGAFSLIGHATASGERTGAAISFAIALASAPTPHFIAKGATPVAPCPGSATAPTATPGNLCFYEAQTRNVQFQGFEDPVTGHTGGEVEPFGADVTALSASAGDFNESGAWAVTAP